MMSLSLRWTCQRDRVLLLVKFRLNKNNFVLKKSFYLNKMIILFKYCANVENYENFKGFGRVLLLVKFRLNKNNFV